MFVTNVTSHVMAGSRMLWRAREQMVVCTSYGVTHAFDTDVVRIQDPNARITKPLPRRQWRYRLPLFALNSFNTTTNE